MKSFIALIVMSMASLSFAAEPAKEKPTAPAATPAKKAEKPAKKVEAKKDLGKKPTAKKVEQK